MGDVDTRCPACGTRVGNAATCSSCGLDLSGPQADEIRNLGARLQALDAEIDAITAQRRQIAADFQRMRVAVRDAGRQWEPPAMSEWPRARHELNLEGVRNVLLALGTTLLALAALAFTAVAWARMGDGGRAALLAGVTVVALALALVLRRRLPATAEALGGLAIALALIDWYALRRAGFAAGVSDTAWWATGTATVGGFTFAVVRSAAPRTSRFAVALLFPAAAVLLVSTIAGAAWSTGLGLALVAGAMVAVGHAVSHRDGFRGTATLLDVEASLVWLAGAGASAAAAAQPASVVAILLPAAAVLAAGVAPAIRVVGSPRNEVLPAALVAASVLGALLTVIAESVDEAGVLLAAAVLALSTLAVAGWVSPRWRRGFLLAGCVALVPGSAWAFVAAAVATFAPLAWLNDAWSGDPGKAAREVVAGPGTSDPLTVGWVPVTILLVGVLAAVVVATRAPHRRRLAQPRGALAAAASGFGLALALGPIAGGATVALTAAFTAVAACTLLIVWAAVARQWPHSSLAMVGAALVPAIAATGWASTSPRASVGALGALLVTAATAAWIGRAEPLRTLHLAVTGAAATTLAGVATMAAVDDASAAGFAVATTAVAIAAVGAVVRRQSPDPRACELVGAAGFLIGLALSVSDVVYFAFAATISVPILLLATSRRERRTPYGIAASLAALAATWAWLVVMDVRMVEAYTVPAALSALLLGVLARKTATARSMLTLGPALVIAFGPTLALAVRDDDVIRAVAVGIAAFAAVLVGAQRRLQAPLVIGSAVLVALGIDTLGPAAAELPRWVVLAVPGALLVWVGATFERRRESLRDIAHAFAQLG